jgi:predicted TIM-barrel fold metal-dependent hydrolase
LYFPFYNQCIEAGAPALLYVGMTGLGAGLPGGGGYPLDYFRPIPYIDDVAAQFPDLTIIASHPAWPWHNEMIAVLLHKPNVYNDLHGWSPKYFPSELKREINGRLQDRFLFGADYPMFNHDRLFSDWEAQSYRAEVMEKLFVKNAQRILNQVT